VPLSQVIDWEELSASEMIGFVSNGTLNVNTIKLEAIQRWSAMCVTCDLEL